MSGSSERPIHMGALPTTSYNEPIVPQTHVAWKGRQFAYPTEALQASWIGTGGGQLRGTFDLSRLGKRVSMLAAHERVSVTGLPEYQGALRAGPQ